MAACENNNEMETSGGVMKQRSGREHIINAIMLFGHQIINVARTRSTRASSSRNRRRNNTNARVIALPSYRRCAISAHINAYRAT